MSLFTFLKCGFQVSNFNATPLPAVLLQCLEVSVNGNFQIFFPAFGAAITSGDFKFGNSCFSVEVQLRFLFFFNFKPCDQRSK